MANVKKAISQFIGGIQCVIGVLASVFAFIIYTSSSMRETLAITSEGEVYLYMFLSSILACFQF
ncbi:MAG: hypothetical protein QW468_05940 [Candidatus Bathyarchaeia archaeon]